ncbi:MULTISPECIES: hypothetical protein [Streptomyces]|uniref:hypothetical protein n=1 Tax=Streptomyces TaxID=1883 RepID=UPI0029BE2B20|nr:hypothetical protein [Streptomyces europaeiscabiei]MDX3781492.1 hypothetical protein [Streptomyces europaeiscabiei]
MASSSRKEIPAPVTNRLFALSGNQCAFPGCSSPVTFQEASGEKPVTLAQRAHLVGVGRQGPRSKEAPLSDDPDAVENLTLFCGTHHAIVDGNPRIYSVEVLAKYKADHEATMAAKDLRVPPPPFETDSVDVSVLSISELPGLVWRAESRFRTSMEVIERLPRPMRGQVLPFVLANGQVWTFHDLADTRGPFKHVVKPESTQCLDAAELLDAQDRNIYVWLLNSALRMALRKRGIQYDRDHGRYYFLADHETVTRRVEAKTKTGRNQSAKKVVRQEGELVGNPRDVWWHLAAQLRFEEFATGMWGLTIRPEFHLTKDGKVPLDPRRVGRKVTKRKSRMYNEGYFDAVHFFRYFLLDGRARVVFEVGHQKIAIDGDFPQVDAKWPLIDDNRFNPVTMLDSGDEDDVIDALASSWHVDDEEWDWGAEHKEDDK